MLDEVVKRCPPLPENSKFLILGAGFSGQHFAQAARALGGNVLCSRRGINKPGADFIFDSNTKILPSIEVLKDVTHILCCIPPAEDGTDPVLNSLKTTIQRLPLKWVGYLSTTGVYGDSEGEWVYEKNSPNPKQLRSKRRLACEKAWQSSELPLQILRLPGIYGPGRSAIEIIDKGKNKMIEKSGQIFSRIHVDDITGAILHLIHLNSRGTRPNVINIADNLPTSNVEVLSYAANLLNKELPKLESFEIASKNMSPMARSFWEENRRVSNDLLCKKLGYSLIHPSYKAGLKDCFKNLQMRAHASKNYFG